MVLCLIFLNLNILMIEKIGTNKMDHDKSIEFLNKCCEELKNMPQEEFDRIEKEKGIGDIVMKNKKSDYYKSVLKIFLKNKVMEIWEAIEIGLIGLLIVLFTLFTFSVLGIVVMWITSFYKVVNIIPLDLTTIFSDLLMYGVFFIFVIGVWCLPGIIIYKFFKWIKSNWKKAKEEYSYGQYVAKLDE